MKIITAIGNPKLNNELLKIKKHEIIGKDIQYQDGIFEMLEKNKNIDLIFIKEKILGKLKFNELINKIKEINKNIKIIVVLEKENKKINELLNSKKIDNLFFENEINKNKIEEIINGKIKRNFYNTENDKKINIKKLISKKNIKKIMNNIEKIIIKKNILKKENKIICVLGAKKIGKTIFSIILSFSFENKKILLININDEENILFTILGIKYNNDINKINKNLDIFSLDKNIEKNKKQNIIKKISENYDFIIFDISSNNDDKNIKEIIKNSNINIFLVEPNLLGIKKSRDLLDKYINKWNIKKEKIKIIFNKVNINSIDKKILKELFYDFNILGKIKMNNKYDLLINKNMKNIDKKIKKEYLKIIEKI